MSVRRKRVLIVDDEPLQLEAASFILTDAGYDVATAAGGSEALELFCQAGADAVLTDLKMRAGGGLELLAAVRRLKPLVPVIVISASGTEALPAASRSEATALVSKPVDFEALLALLARLLAKK